MILERFVPPNKFSIWKLPKVIKNLEKFGVSSSEYRIYFYNNILKPLFSILMIIILFTYFKLDYSNINLKKTCLNSLFIGIVIFFAVRISSKILLYSNISIPISSSSLIVIICLMHIFVVLKRQEG
jgi:lipopolysaccharide export LptBFGC system permease protein LptF